MSASITAATRVAAVIGEPVRHSLSPAIHNAAFDACGIDGVYVALPVAAGLAPDAITAMRTFDWYGLSVTMPHKQAVVEVCDRLTDVAAQLNAVNCVFWSDGQVVGDNTDGPGFVAGLTADLGVDPAGLDCVVAGAGGAAGAVIKSLADAGAARVLVVNRTADRARVAAQLAGERGVVGTIGDLRTADVVVNATPIGMASTAEVDSVPFDVAELRDDAVVVDLIYHPAETRLLTEAKRRGLRCQNGLPMLVHQAALQFERWTGVTAPVDVMTSAVVESLNA